MANGVLELGENARLQARLSDEVRVRLSVTGAAPLRLIGVLLDAEGRAIGPAPLLTWRQEINQVQINLGKAETISAIMHTAAVAEPIQAMMFLVAPYGRENFLPGERIFTAVASDGTDPIAIESVAPDDRMQAVAMFEFYRHPIEGVKIRGRNEWRHHSLASLLEHLGVPSSVITEQNLYPLLHARKSDADRASLKQLTEPPVKPPSGPQQAPQPIQAASSPAAKPSSLSLSSQPVPLGSADEPRRISAANGKFGEIVADFCWHQPVATRARVKIRLGCLWELQDSELQAGKSRKGKLPASDGACGSTTESPFIGLRTEPRQSGALWDIGLTLNGGEWSRIRRLLIFAIIDEGSFIWRQLDARITLSVPNQPPIIAEIIPSERQAPIAALLLLENRSEDICVSAPGGQFESFYALDSAFNFGLHWQKDPQDPRDTASATEWVPPAQRGFWQNLLDTFFGNSAYSQAEDLMRASLAAAALVMVADGHVDMAERKKVIDGVMCLPMGRLFAEFEVRSLMETILRDLKQHRKLSENLTLAVLEPFRRRGEAQIILQAMRRAAMADGAVNLAEERMVEHLTRYLRG